jgi:hypothetical protein
MYIFGYFKRSRNPLRLLGFILEEPFLPNLLCSMLQEQPIFLLKAHATELNRKHPEIAHPE